MELQSQQTQMIICKPKTRYCSSVRYSYTQPKDIWKFGTNILIAISSVDRLYFDLTCYANSINNVELGDGN